MKARTRPIRSIIGIQLRLQSRGPPLGRRAVCPSAGDQRRQGPGDESDNRFGPPGVQDSEAQPIAVSANGDIVGRCLVQRDRQHRRQTGGALGWTASPPPGRGVERRCTRRHRDDGNELYAVGNFTSADPRVCMASPAGMARPGLPCWWKGLRTRTELARRLAACGRHPRRQAGDCRPVPG